MFPTLPLALRAALPSQGANPAVVPMLKAKRAHHGSRDAAWRPQPFADLNSVLFRAALGVSEDPNPATIAESKLLLKSLWRRVLVSPRLQERFH